MTVRVNSSSRAGGLSELGAKVRFQPDEARAEIEAAIASAGGVSAAAKRLGVSHSTLKRWLAILGLSGRWPVGRRPRAA